MDRAFACLERTGVKERGRSILELEESAVGASYLIHTRLSKPFGLEVKSTIQSGKTGESHNGAIFFRDAGRRNG